MCTYVPFGRNLYPPSPWLLYKYSLTTQDNGYVP